MENSKENMHFYTRASEQEKLLNIYLSQMNGWDFSVKPWVYKWDVGSGNSMMCGIRR